MKIIEAVINTTCLEEVKSALSNIGIEKIMVHKLIRRGSDKSRLALDHGAGYISGFITKIRLEIVATDELVGKVIDTIGEIARRESMGICRIFIHPMAEAHV